MPKYRKKMILVTYSYPPFEESHSIRTLHFSNEIARKFDYHVITIKLPKLYYKRNNPTVSLINSDVKIFRTFPGFLDWVLALLKVYSGNTLTRLLWKFLLGIYSRIYPYNRDKFEWFQFSFKKIEDFCKEIVPDIIFASSGHPVSLLIGYKIKRKFPKAKLVLDYGDPWSLNELSPVYINKEIVSVEEEILKSADLIIFTTEATKEKYKKVFNIDGKVIPMGVDLALFNSKKDIRINLEEKSFNIVYTGVAYGHRNLKPFLEAFIELITKENLNLKLYLVGDISEKFRKEINNLKLSSYVEILGWVDYISSIEYMKRSDLLLLLGNKSSDQIPGKVYMYLASGRPILYLSHTLENDPTIIEVLKDFKGVYLSNYSSILDIKKNVLNAYYTYFHKCIDIYRDVDKYDWKKLSVNLIEYINSLE